MSEPKKNKNNNKNKQEQKLRFDERLFLQEIMPEKDSYHNLTIREDLLAKMKITQQDMVDHKLTVDDQGTKWINGDKIKKFTITELEDIYIKQKLKKQNDAEILDVRLKSLYKEKCL